MTDITIPPAALEAAEEAHSNWKSTYPLKDAMIAMLEAWPRVFEQQFYELTADGKRITFPVLILPLTEKTDDKA